MRDAESRRNAITRNKSGTMIVDPGDVDGEKRVIARSCTTEDPVLPAANIRNLAVKLGAGKKITEHNTVGVPCTDEPYCNRIAAREEALR